MEASRQKVLSSPGNGNGAVKKSPLDADFGAFAEGALRRWHVPGISVAVVDGDSTWAEVSCYVFEPSCSGSLLDQTAA